MNPSDGQEKIPNSKLYKEIDDVISKCNVLEDEYLKRNDLCIYENQVLDQTKFIRDEFYKMKEDDLYSLPSYFWWTLIDSYPWKNSVTLALSNYRKKLRKISGKEEDDLVDKVAKFIVKEINKNKN
jgi:hypothetical protein